MQEPQAWEVHALVYGAFAGRSRRQSFLSPPDPDDTRPMPVNYYVFALRSAGRSIVVDAGMDHADAAKHGRKIDRLPKEALALLGIDAGTVEDVILTHLHFDHAGTLDDFPRARFHLQEAELAYATGRCMTYRQLRDPYDVEQVVRVVRLVHAGRVRFHDGDSEVAPGVTVHLIGGHAKGLMAVRVWTRRGWMVLAGDVFHFYENFESHRPFFIVHDVEAALRGFDRVNELADGPDHVVPGHDPLIMARYPAAAPDLEGVVARLDLEPAPAPVG